MSYVRPPGDQEPTQVTPTKTLRESSVAMQKLSQGTILADIQAKPQHQSTWVSFLKWIEAFFIDRNVREDYLVTLKDKFVEQADDAQLSPEARDQFVNIFIPLLSNLPIEDLQYFESLLTTPEGIQLIKKHLVNNPNRANLSAAFATLPQLAKLVGGLSPEKQLQYLEAWMLYGKDLKPQEFKNLAQSFNAHINYAEQLQSKVDLLSNNEAKRLSDYFTAARVQTKDMGLRLAPFSEALTKAIIDKRTRNAHLKTLENRFLAQVKKGNYSQEVSNSYESFFKPLLAKLSIEDLPFFESLLTTPEGIQLIEKHLVNNPNRANLLAAFATLPRVAKLIGRLSPADQLKYLEAWMLYGEELVDSVKFKKLAKNFEAHIAYAEHLQSLRPQIFEKESKEAVKLFSYFGECTSIPVDGAALLKSFHVGIQDTSIIYNLQIVQNSIAAFYTGPTSTGGVRTIPIVEGRIQDFDSSIYNQIEIPFTLKDRPDDEVIDFKATTNVYLTDPFTMETRTVRVELPISGKMKVGDAKKQLELLQHVVGVPQNFDDVFEYLNLPLEQKETLRNKFLPFSKRIATIFQRNLQDFNSTPTRPRESTSRSDPTNVNAIQNPDDPFYSLEAAKLRNLFLLDDKRLSLIPSGPGELHKQIGTLSDDEYANASKILLGKLTATPLVVPELDQNDVVTFKDATLSIHVKEEPVQTTSGFRSFPTVEFVITKDGQTTKRKVYYDYSREGQTLEELKQEIIDSRLFERDLLLAKSAFMEEHVK
jgi:hypothetical protein